MALNTSANLLIPQEFHETYHSLNGVLRDLVDKQMKRRYEKQNDVILRLMMEFFSNIPFAEPQINHSVERLLKGLFTNGSSDVIDTLGKVLKIVKQGLIKELFEEVDKRKIIGPSKEEIVNRIDRFCQKHLKQVTKLPKDETSAAQKSGINSNLQASKAFHSLGTCQKFYLFQPLVEVFLASLPYQKKWKEDNYRHFYFLLNTDYVTRFKEPEKLMIAKVLFETHNPKRSSPLRHCSHDDLNQWIESCYQLKQKGGEETLYFYVQTSMTCESISVDELIRVSNLLLKRLNMAKFSLFLKKWQRHISEWNYLTEQLDKEIAKETNNIDLPDDDLEMRISRFASDPVVTVPLPQKFLEMIRDQYTEIDRLCHLHKHLTFNELISIAHHIRRSAQSNSIQPHDRLQLIAIGRLAYRLEFGIYPYSTQILALLGLFVSGKHTQAQAKTGEGKSTIVTLYAFVKAMECKAVDLISSARSYSVRDYQKAANFFKRCDVTSGHICVDKKTSRHFRAQILYGPSFDFEFAWLEDTLCGSNLYQSRLSAPYVQRNFDVICVDESDNLLVDSALNQARLSTPAEESFDWVYAPILTFVKSESKSDINNDDDNDDFDTISDSGFKRLRNHLMRNLKGQNQEDCIRLTDDQLATWLSSARDALYHRKENVHYVVKTRLDDEGRHIKEIQIVDIGTGRISENSRWQKGIHEFLEVKHDIPVKRESLCPITLSHAVFYRFYQTIVSLTGTAERFQTKEIYDIDSFDVPPHLPLKRIDLPTIMARDKAHYLQLILECTRDYSEKLKRPILLLCRTIENSIDLAKQMDDVGIGYQLLNEIQKEKESDIVSKAGHAGQVTIATNNAGRATDIVLTKESLANGGLFVLPTFWFTTKREEDQGIGRAGRQGQPGSSQIIINKEDPEIQAVISKLPKEASDQDLLRYLDVHRDAREKAQAHRNMNHAKLEIFLSEKTEDFFNVYMKWSNYVKHDEVLDSWAKTLQSCDLTTIQGLAISKPTKVDTIIAEQLICLFKKNDSTVVEWKLLIKEVIERIRNKALVEWVKNFFEPAEQNLDRIAAILSALQVNFEKRIEYDENVRDERDGYTTFDIFGQLFREQLQDCVSSEKEKISKHYEDHKAHWNKYLTANGSGIFLYIKELIGIDLHQYIDLPDLNIADAKLTHSASAMD